MPVSGKPGLFGLLFRALLTLAMIGGFAWLVVNRQGVADWWQLRQYQPSSEAIIMAEATRMQGRGRDLFYLSDPVVQDAEAFNMNCQDIGEGGSVLGCYNLQKIYIFNVTDKRLPHVKEVTAAHEMLHAAYDRLDSAAREQVDAMVQAAANKLKADPELKETMDLYRKTEPGELLNELHSILGTEYANLPSDLENYYRQYFSDRSRVVGFAQEYKDVFRRSKTRLARDDAQLAALKQQIDASEADLQNRKLELATDRKRLLELRGSNVEAYNQAVPGYNMQVDEFNGIAKTYNALVREYNNLVEVRNKEAAAQNDLYHSLDSKYQKIN